VRRLREVVLGPGRQPKVTLCALHGEKLQLFCKEDGRLICWLCERSQEHRGHHTFLMEEVAQEYQVGTQDGGSTVGGSGGLSLGDLLAVRIKEYSALWSGPLPKGKRVGLFLLIYVPCIFSTFSFFVFSSQDRTDFS
jgi:hypothetical protein